MDKLFLLWPLDVINSATVDVVSYLYVQYVTGFCYGRIVNLAGCGNAAFCILHSTFCPISRRLVYGRATG